MIDLSRRQALKLGMAGAGVAAFSNPASALVKIVVSGGDFEPMPIGVPVFSSSDPQLAAEITSIVVADLKRSGLFAPMSESQLPLKQGDVNANPDFGAWRNAQADALVMGSVNEVGGQIRADVRLWDVVEGAQAFGESFAADRKNTRRVAHIVADAIYAKLTGESGYFDTRVVYVAESGPKANRTKRLAIMDQDGANVQYLTRGDSIVLTPRYSPRGNLLSYMNFAGDVPQIYLLDLSTGKQQRVADFGKMTLSPRFSPDGQNLAFSVTNGANTNLYLMNLQQRKPAALTSGAAIDTSPSFSPDGSRLAFESDRGGSQQIYVMNSNGGGAQRISFGEGRYSTPVWSPKGDLIAFTKQSEGQFHIGTMRQDGSGERILSSSYLMEGPTWAPNGRVLMFFKDPGGDSGPQLYSIDIWGRNELRIPTETFASDPTWSPLLK
ncbi:Tol-Pal system beta propeller repeat protein TolB [Maritalea porphyrae]|uniref:Tol-Pal system beta propeller repeat protein TolB n=1 Tax=Maritalea porphyrae TaxID=880732 RepID=UPI0022AECF80|nr:Tol-Pal system beta propeller repeat protein TolB [Maritalea porphyrae]MCZ4273668.1 Tol-Pal system beta propeller repeat protein TolB [Maritalea porphyrae]